MRPWNSRPWVAYHGMLLQQQNDRPTPPGAWQRLLRKGSVAGLWVAFVLCIAFPLLLLTLTANAHAADAIPRAATTHRLALKREAQRVWGLDAPTASFAAQIHQESRWRENARSPVGAQGLAQFMPATAQWIGGFDTTLKPTQPFSAAWSLRALVVYDKWLYDRVRGVDECNRMAFAMAAYNGGLGWVNKRKARSPQPGVCFGVTCAINPGITAANQRENQHYPEVILKRYEPLYANTWGWGRGVCQ